jgi:hypothetical protein
VAKFTEESSGPSSNPSNKSWELHISFIFPELFKSGAGIPLNQIQKQLNLAAGVTDGM